MDLLKKVETLLNAKARSVVSGRRRRSILDEQEADVLAEIRRALGDVEAKERELASRIKKEQAEAESAAKSGDQANYRAHQRRADELERHLEQESIFAINLEEKLAALEEKLALAKDAVDKESRNVAARDAAASEQLAQGIDRVEAEAEMSPPAKTDVNIPASFDDDESAMSARKSRLSG